MKKASLLVGLSVPAISRVERGETRAPLDIIECYLAEFLGVQHGLSRFFGLMAIISKAREEAEEAGAKPEEINALIAGFLQALPEVRHE